MLGYMANPSLGPEVVKDLQDKNREAIDEQGWLHSGDLGIKGVNGMFRITGRIKELIIGAGGESAAAGGRTLTCGGARGRGEYRAGAD
jgi:acyl-CoA synthetase (AMP-forming)/AMP-acid ligase II